MSGKRKYNFYIYKMEYYLVIKKREIQPFVTTLVKSEGIMLNEIRQTKMNTV